MDDKSAELRAALIAGELRRHQFSSARSDLDAQRPERNGEHRGRDHGSQRTELYPERAASGAATKRRERYAIVLPSLTM